MEESPSLDVNFHNKNIFLPATSSIYELEEMLAHELGHFLIAPADRRYLEDYGHDARVSLRIKQREELAATILGMSLQRLVGSPINMKTRAYLWNLEPESWRESGFWVGAGILVEHDWLNDDFTINQIKLKEMYIDR